MHTRFASALILAVTALGAAPAPLNMTTDIDMSGAPQSVVFLEREFAPGQSSGLHIHHGIEMNMVIAGTLSVTVGDRPPREMHEGDSILIPREVPHVAVNTGTVPAKVVITYVVDRGRPLKEAVAP